MGIFYTILAILLIICCIPVMLIMVPPYLLFRLQAWSESQVKKPADPEMTCDVCHEHKAIGVAAVPGIPCSVAYCKHCLDANSHPMHLLVVATALMGGLEYGAIWWQAMVQDSIKDQDVTLEWFNNQVKDEMLDIANEIFKGVEDDDRNSGGNRDQSPRRYAEGPGDDGPSQTG